MALTADMKARIQNQIGRPVVSNWEIIEPNRHVDRHIFYFRNWRWWRHRHWTGVAKQWEAHEVVDFKTGETKNVMIPFLTFRCQIGEGW